MERCAPWRDVAPSRTTRRSDSTRSPHHPSRVCDRIHSGGLRRRVGSPGLRFLVADSTKGNHRRRAKTTDRGFDSGEHDDVDERRSASRFGFDDRPGVGSGAGTRHRRAAPARTNGHDAHHRPRRGARGAHGREFHTLGGRRRDGARDIAPPIQPETKSATFREPRSAGSLAMPTSRAWTRPDSFVRRASAPPKSF